MALSPAPRSWSSALPDLLAFAVGLAVVWVRGWSTTDLIWPLWLSSLVVGYALIVWAVAQPALELLGLGWRHRAEVEASPAWRDPMQRTLCMHVVIIAFSALHAARRESFSVFAVVYALYFFRGGSSGRSSAVKIRSAARR